MDIGQAWKQMEAIRRQRWEQSIYPRQRHVPETYPKTDENATDSEVSTPPPHHTPGEGSEQERRT